MGLGLGTVRGEEGQKGVAPWAGQDPQLGKQVCQLMSALAAKGRGAGAGEPPGWVAGQLWGLFIPFISSTLYLILPPLAPPAHTLGP